MKFSRARARLFPPFFTYFVDNFGLAIVYPIFTPLFLLPSGSFFGHQDLSLLQRTLLLGLLIASFPFAQFLGAPLFGALSDRIGRKRLFLTTLAGGIIGYTLTGMGIHIKYLPLLWGGRLLTGFFAGNLTLCLAAVTDQSHLRKDRPRLFGWVGIVGGLSFISAIVVSSNLANPKLESWFHPEDPFFIAASLALLALLSVLFFYREIAKHPPDYQSLSVGLKNIGRAIKGLEGRAIYLSFFLFMFAWITSLQFFSAYLIDIFKASRTLITIAFTLIGLSWILANFLVNPLLARHLRPARTFQIALGGVALFLFFSLIPQPIPIFLFHFVAAAFFAGLCWTNSFAAISLTSNQLFQGSSLGVTQSIGAIAMTLGPLAGGVLGGIDIRALYALTASCSLLGGLLLFRNSGLTARPTSHRKKG